MKTAVYKRDGQVRIWGMKAHLEIIDSTELETYLNAGWCAHPAELTQPEPESEPDDDLTGDPAPPEVKKRGRRPKGAASENDH